MRGRFLIGLTIFATMPFLTGCATSSNTAKGAGVGGLLGAGTGALIGKATNGKAGQGAVIGGLLGAGLGGVIGNEEDRREKEILQARARQADARAVAAASQLGIADIIQLAKDGRSDELIINQIRTTNSTYQLSTEDLRMLSSNGVSDRVIMEMQNRRPELYPRPRYIHGPPPVFMGPPQPVYVIPGPPPPPAFGVGIGIHN